MGSDCISSWLLLIFLLEITVNTIEPRVTEDEKSCSFISKDNDDRKKELDRAKGEIVKL